MTLKKPLTKLRESLGRRPETALGMTGGRRRGFRSSAFVEELLQLLCALQRRQHERVPVVVVAGRGVEALEDGVAERGLRHDSSDLPCPGPRLPSGR
jgi:hypothetical protein